MTRTFFQLNELLGWIPVANFDVGLKEIVRYYKDHFIW